MFIKKNHECKIATVNASFIMKKNNYISRILYKEAPYFQQQYQCFWVNECRWAISHMCDASGDQKSKMAAQKILIRISAWIIQADIKVFFLCLVVATCWVLRAGPVGCILHNRWKLRAYVHFVRGLAPQNIWLINNFLWGKNMFDNE